MAWNETSEIYTLDELAKKYPRQWIAASVVERDSQNGQPLKVRFMAREITAMSVRSAVNSPDFCTIYTGPIPEIDHVGMF
jgi:hypothetical protein